MQCLTARAAPIFSLPLCKLALPAVASSALRVGASELAVLPLCPRLLWADGRLEHANSCRKVHGSKLVK